MQRGDGVHLCRSQGSQECDCFRHCLHKRDAIAPAAASSSSFWQESELQRRARTPRSSSPTVRISQQRTQLVAQLARHTSLRPRLDRGVLLESGRRQPVVAWFRRSKPAFIEAAALAAVKPLGGTLRGSSPNKAADALRSTSQLHAIAADQNHDPWHHDAPPELLGLAPRDTAHRVADRRAAAVRPT